MTYKPVYTVANLAEHWGVSGTFVYSHLNSGQLKGFKLGGKLWRIGHDAVLEFENLGSVVVQPPASLTIDSEANQGQREDRTRARLVRLTV